MNFELVPCCITDCDRAGQYGVTNKRGTVYMCAEHAQAVMDRAKKQGLPFHKVENDE